GDGPAGLVEVAGEAAQGAGVGGQLHGSAVELAAQGQLLYRCKALPLSGCNQSVGIVLAEAADHAQAQADAVFALAVVLQGAVPVAVAHVYRPGFDAMAAGVLQTLVGAVEALVQAVDQDAGEGGRLVALEPDAGVGQQCEAGGVGLRYAVVAKPRVLLEQAFDQLPSLAALGQALGELHP